MHFETLFFTEGRYAIEQTDGQLRDNYTQRIISPSQDPNTRERYFTDIPGISEIFNHQRISAGLLVLLSKYQITIPERHWCRLKAAHINGNVADLRVNNLYLDYVNGPIESLYHPGYFYVPEVRGILVSRDCKVISYAAGELNKRIESIATGADYLEISARRSDGVLRSFKIHILMALAFCHRPGNPFGLSVNHIDLNTHNNEPDNLEYVAQEVNTFHYHLFAGHYRNVIEVHTANGDKQLCDTPYAAAALVGVTPSDIWKHFRHTPEQLLNNCRVILTIKVMINDSTAFNKTKTIAEVVEPIECKNLETNEVLTFPNPNALAKALGVSDTGVRVVLTRPKGTIYLGRYLLKYLSDSWPTQEQIDTNRASNAPKVVLVRDEATGLVSEYPSAYKAISALNESKKVVTVSLRNNDRRLINGRRFMYKPDDPTKVIWHVV